MKEYAAELFDLLANGAHIYFCGLKGMMPGKELVISERLLICGQGSMTC